MEFINEQSSLLATVKKTLRNYKKDSTTRRTEAYFKTRLEMLATLRAEFRENHRQIMRLDANEVIKEKYLDIDLNDQFEEQYLEAVSTVRAAFESAYPVVTVAAESNTLSSNINVPIAVSNPSYEVTLPEVKLPMFDGNYVEWPTFKEMFIARVHDSNRLNDSQRLHYLKGALSGAPAKDIEHLSPLAENYADAWKMLCDLYDNKRILFSHFMDVFERKPDVHPNDAAHKLVVLV
ncbi:uncharacterized protein LOC118741936 [Rhagoletis pomonella]|uniref:uncharacterized protein LOC118741936 n=1 Tax=Rhagoletis pomonella TaxID=28610 RepID=UPI00177B11FB|nr:uncharacterized protein LOC118741936 [Rhagoletis pomonella]